MSACLCAIIQAADPLRHFTGCPLREPLPEGHPAAGSCVKPESFAAEVSAETDRVEAEGETYGVGASAHGCAYALDDVRSAIGTAEQHRYLVRLAAWALVALRAEARETAAKGGGVGDAKRVDLNALRMLAQTVKPLDTLVLRDAITEIEAARAAPVPSPTPGLAEVLGAFSRAAVGLAQSIVGEMVRRHEAGPSRAERLVRYRCAAMRIAWDGAEEGEADTETAKAADNIAHAMLAAEREPSHG